MNQTRTFEINGGGFHTLTIDDSQIKIESYTLGSLAGGTFTETSYTIDQTGRADFFTEIGIKDSEELFARLDAYVEIDWSNLRSVIFKHKTDSFFWAETDWSDSIKIKVELTGDPKVGSILTATAHAKSTEGTFPVAYQWYINDKQEGSYRLIESATDQEYLITADDRGCFIRFGASAGDAVGFNSSFAPSNSIGPIT